MCFVVGYTFTINAISGQTVTFGAALKNLQASTGGGLTVQGGGSVLFDNKQYQSGMNIGALYVDGATVTLPASVSFGSQGSSGTSYSPITLNNSAILILNNGSADDACRNSASAYQCAKYR